MKDHPPILLGEVHLPALMPGAQILARPASRGFVLPAQGVGRAEAGVLTLLPTEDAQADETPHVRIGGLG